MTDHIESPIDATHVRRVLALDAALSAPPRQGYLIGIGLPAALADALEIPPADRENRDGWLEWMPRIKRVGVALLWMPPRREDDQAFLAALASNLPISARLWSFHAMGIMTTDRLTGDAVQTLLATAGLADRGCVNSGFGYFARRFERLTTDAD